METINTCSEVISLARKLEEGAAAFYRELARRFPEGSELFMAFAKENEHFISLVERAYYGVISDAYEGCFAFDIAPEKFQIQTSLPEGATWEDAMAAAAKIEEKMVAFYKEAASQSKALMADMPRAMQLVAKKRAERLERLESAIQSVS